MGSGVWPLAVATRLAKPPWPYSSGHFRLWAFPPPEHHRPGGGFAPLGFAPLGVAPLGGMAGGICEGGGGSIWRAAMGGRLMGACRCTPAVFRLSPAGAGESIRIGRVRAISTGRLRGLLRFHFRPIDVVVFHGSRRDLVLRRVSRLDAFSGYPVRT